MATISNSTDSTGAQKQPLNLPTVKMGMARRAFAQRDYTGAEKLYLQVLQAEPLNLEANNAIASLYLIYNREDRARPFLETVVREDPGNFEASIKLAGVAHYFGQLQQTRQLLKPLVQASKDAIQLAQLATKARKTWQLDITEAALLRMLELEPTDARTYSTLGVLYGIKGNAQLAEQYYRKATALDPHCMHAHFNLSRLISHTPDSPDIVQMETLLRENSDALAPLARMFLFYGLGKAYEDIARYDEAMALYIDANRLEGGSKGYREDVAMAKFANIKQVLSKEFFLEHTPIGSPSNCPIFVVGMPRSGTSLVEQILASHSEVFGGGELDDMHTLSIRLEQGLAQQFPSGIDTVSREELRQLAQRYLTKTAALSGNAQRVVDKMPANFFYIGLITLLFPNAKIIHCRRCPEDTALSIFKHVFEGAHAYSHNLSTLGRYFREYLALMRHWHDALPFRIYDIAYEDLISNTGDEVRALLKFCDLSFEQQCLSFYTTRRAVDTVSAAQVRQPIYGSSVHGWKNFETQFATFQAALNSPAGSY
ncbi:sulfotransferase family protein [Halieaceae bacterium IMCC14734]|uniref:Sulfotransferase family protein n=1 Tax=Candidatus Litorirhabdus singularis TaxID=2518993 RepID=A0ABT3TFA4_9GAMM|nr:tetratricopeptide repeat-containing sulfotransferase family protein [Candidatus Litorirhabdus singularis]MCX2980976.1 sulfotransferase family protein [Candidatus Litorirhabdus singularis]